MKNPFSPGAIKIFKRKIQATDAATFDSGNVHLLYSTFSLGRDAEWACRLFILEMKDQDEEGIGTFLKVEHSSPALIGEEIVFEAIFDSFIHNELLCNFTAKVGSRIIAAGQTKQKILKKVRLDKIFKQLKTSVEE